MIQIDIQRDSESHHFLKPKLTNKNKYTQTQSPNQWNNPGAPNVSAQRWTLVTAQILLVVWIHTCCVPVSYLQHLHCQPPFFTILAHVQWFSNSNDATQIKILSSLTWFCVNHYIALFFTFYNTFFLVIDRNTIIFI